MKRSTLHPGTVYKFVHNEDVWIKTNLTGRNPDNEDPHDWLKIENDGTITVKGSRSGGFAWNGCSPKWNCLQFTWGTPDGKLDYETERPVTYYASMIHDAIYFMKGKVNISRKETDVLFRICLRKARFMWGWKYFFAVRIFGWMCGKWAREGSASGIKISGYSWL